MAKTRKEVEWADREVRIDGAVAVKLLGLKYKYGVDSEHLYAAGRIPLGIQLGNITPEGELKMLKGDFDSLNQAAIAAGYPNICFAPLTIIDSWKAAVNRPVQTNILLEVMINEFEVDAQQGAKNVPITLPFRFVELKMNYVP